MNVPEQLQAQPDLPQHHDSFLLTTDHSAELQGTDSPLTMDIPFTWSHWYCLLLAPHIPVAELQHTDVFVLVAQHWCAGTAGFWDVSAVLVYITASQDASAALVHRDSAIGLTQMRAHSQRKCTFQPRSSLLLMSAGLCGQSSVTHCTQVIQQLPGGNSYLLLSCGWI